MKSTKEHLGSQIKLARLRLGLTQEQLAERAEKSVETISNIERGVVFPGLEALEELAAVLSVPLRELFPEHDADPAESALRTAEADLLRVVAGMPDADLAMLIEIAKLVRRRVDSQGQS